MVFCAQEVRTMRVYYSFHGWLTEMGGALYGINGGNNIAISYTKAGRLRTLLKGLGLSAKQCALPFCVPFPPPFLRPAPNGRVLF